MLVQIGAAFLMVLMAGRAAELPASDWAQIRAEYEKHRHQFVQTCGGFAARNPGNGWVAEFDGSGFSLRPDKNGWQWGLELRAISGQAVARGTKGTVLGDALTYRRNRYVDEWFVNRISGLEHGYTVRQRPANGLSFRLAVRGDLRAAGSGDAIRFTRKGVTVLTYSGLKAWDANHKPLPARLTGYGSEVELTVDDAGAAYPVTVDPTVQTAYVKSSNTGNGDQFGLSVAASGNTVVVGARGEASNATGVNGNQANNSAASSGAVYVFVRSGSAWVQQAYLKASNTGSVDNFGFSVDISGDTMIVGALTEDSDATGVNGNQSNNNAPDSGAAYIFTRSGTTWSQQAYLKASNTGTGDRFGTSVAISGDVAVVGAESEDSGSVSMQSDNSAQTSGAAYLFVRSGSTWFQQAYLKAPAPAAFDSFGQSVDIDGDTVVVGAPLRDVGAAGDAGAAYVYAGAGIWSLQANLFASTSGTNDFFGTSVAVSGDTVLVGAVGEGAAFVFTRSGTTWSQQAILRNGKVSDSPGYSVGISGNLAIVGAPFEDNDATGGGVATDSGAAYLYYRNGTSWSLVDYLKAFNAGAGDRFGTSVAISGNLAVVGADNEGSNATGVGGDGANNLSPGSGAAYFLDVVPFAVSRIGTFTSGIWALDLNGNYFNEGAAPDRNVLFSLGSSSEIPVSGDWNGDGITDVAVYLNGTWLIDANGNGVWDGPSADKLIFFGGAGYTPYTGDWNGDGKTDIAVHQNGTWLIDFNGNFAWDGTPTDKLIFFGGAGYAPYIGKWGNSANSSVAVHLNGTWLIDLNGNFQWDGPATDGLLFFGGPGYTPVTGDWNGDGKTDLGAYLNGTWIVDFNGNYAWDGTVTDRLVFFGGAGFIPVSGDWNGDGKDKVGGFSAGTWVLDRNGNYTWDGSVTDVVTAYGTTTSRPVPGKWK